MNLGQGTPEAEETWSAPPINLSRRHSHGTTVTAKTILGGLHHQCALENWQLKEITK
jgi:hypothetical protein